MTEERETVGTCPREYIGYLLTSSEICEGRWEGRGEWTVVNQRESYRFLLR